MSTNPNLSAVHNKILIITRQMSRLAMRITAVLQRAGYGTAILESPDHGDHHGGGIAALVLPGVRGTELKSQVSQLHEKLGERIPIIALCRPREAIGEILRNGANDAVHLPTTDRLLLLRLHRALERCESRKNQFSLIAQLEKQRDKLSRYFSPKELQRILTSDEESTVSGEMAKGTFLVFDLRDSTSRAERMGPEKFFPFLAELFADLSDLVHGHDGTISKFTGDGFLAIFGCPDFSRKSVLNAMLCATRIRTQISIFNSLLPAGEEPVRFGIGIASGVVFRGNLGNVYRLEHTVIGDPVNLATRLEQLTKQVGKDILVDGETLQMAGEGVSAEKLGVSSVRGRQKSVDIYYLVSVAEFCAL